MRGDSGKRETGGKIVVVCVKANLRGIISSWVLRNGRCDEGDQDSAAVPLHFVSWFIGSFLLCIHEKNSTTMGSKKRKRKTHMDPLVMDECGWKK